MRSLSISAVLIALVTPSLTAATLTVTVRDAKGSAVRDAVVYAVPEGRQLPLAKRSAVIDQKDRMFVPHVLPVQTGTAVNFPNSDNVRHHVYSFSPAKTFQLPLYSGVPQNPVVFDKAGVATLGCNIHDRMSAFVVVVDTPFFATTDARGRAVLRDMGAGRYQVRVWYADMKQEPQPISINVTGGERRELSFVAVRAALTPPAAAQSHGRR